MDCDEINIRGIFSNPSDLEGYEQVDGIKCYTQNSEYPVPTDYVPIIIREVLFKEFRVMTATPRDDKNDSAPTTAAALMASQRALSNER